MKNYIISFIVLFGLAFSSCESLVDGINENPNNLLPSDVDPHLMLTGTMLANVVAQGGHANRITGLWSGQLTGFASVYSGVYGYDISTAESTATWSRFYVAMVPNLRYIRNEAPDDDLMVGICKVLEAHAIGTAASLYGDVPYSEINNPAFTDPAFDSQIDVFNDMITLLESAITDLGAASSRTFPEDIHYNGDATAWEELANTLIARYYLQMKDYSSAYTAAQNGISSGANSFRYTPQNSENVQGDKNLFYQILATSRAGDIGTDNSYMMDVLDPVHASYRGNAKTDETARFGYYYVDENNDNNLGFAEEMEPNYMALYEENLLILAECGARTVDFATGLGHLNELRQYLDGGGRLNSNFSGDAHNYDDYVAADFDATTGMENLDGITPANALLREIVEERFISGFGTYMAFNDMRRLRTETEIVVPIPFNVGTATQHPERMPYSSTELTTNVNAPDIDPGIYATTRVNQ